MKLRFRQNSLRFRINRREAALLAEGHELREQLTFVGGITLSYVLISIAPGQTSGAEFDGREIRVRTALGDWARSEEVGHYFQAGAMTVAVEKDLECVDGPEDEKDPHAYPRKAKEC